MQIDEPTYVELLPGGVFRIVGSRIGLESIVVAYLNGQSAEAIQDNLPTLSLETIHGSIAFFLHHRVEVDEYLKSLIAHQEDVQKQSEVDNGPLLARLRAERHSVSPR
jgi:uncharacterized protein (DUF433 family)